MKNFTELRYLTASLAEHYIDESDDPDLIKRSRVIRDVLQESFYDRVPGDTLRIGWDFDEDFLVWRSEWNNIAISGRRLERVEQELEAAFALSAAWGEVIALFETPGSSSFLNEVFSRDVELEREIDARRIADAFAHSVGAERWPIYVVMSIMAIAVALGDTFQGADGAVAGIFGFGGIGGLVYACFLRRNLRVLSDLTYGLERKWNGPPSREIPFMKKISI